MKINEIYKKNDALYRILYLGEKALVIDCTKRTMPYFVDIDFLNDSVLINEDELLVMAGAFFKNELSDKEKSEALLKRASISLILPVVHDVNKRNEAIDISSKVYKISKKTVRNRLCNYLAFMDLHIFVSNQKTVRDLSDDERNFRWVLNKYFYNAHKLTLNKTYETLLKEKYCDFDGNIMQNAPKFHQFKYFYYKTRKESNYIISREGKGEFERNYRPLLGEGIRSFCPSIGYGMLDSTICDIFLVNDSGELLGRPYLVACVDGFSSMCLGYYLGFAGGVKSLVSLMNNVVTNKVEWCKKFGIEINIEQWNCHLLPHKLITDKGREYISTSFSQLVDLGIEIINLPPYRPELKGSVEKFFDIVQGSYKKELASKGVIFEDYQERGGVDYRKKACLTLNDFEKVILFCIINYNNSRVIDLPGNLVGIVQPIPSALWNYSLLNGSHYLIDVSKTKIQLSLLPRCEGMFKRNGLIVNKLRYKNDNYLESYLKGGSCEVAYDPSNVSKVWLIKDGEYVQFDLIESFYLNKDLETVISHKNLKKIINKEIENVVISGNIKLSKDIETIVNSIAPVEVDLKNVRKNRKRERKIEKQ